jgi:hypothetical protein
MKIKHPIENLYLDVNFRVVWFKRKGGEGRGGNLMEGRGRERRGGEIF